MQRRYRRRKPKKFELKSRLRVNEYIRAPRVNVIDEGGENLGEMTIQEALAKADAAELDLVEVSPKADPPVVRIADYGQIKYDRSKKLKKQKAQQKSAETKGVRLSFRIKGADLDMRHNQALKFLEQGHNVKIELILRGRERAHRDKAQETIKKFVIDLGENISEISSLSRQGNRMSIEVTKK